MISGIKFKIVWLAGIFVWATSVSAFAQDAAGDKYFIYIQNEGGTPFYVKKGSAVLSSTPAGYMIIPQLTKGKYQFTIGLPGNKVPEASFSINMQGPDDKGFLLKAGNDQLDLYSIKDLNKIAPVAVASAAGNRIVDVPVPSESPQKQKKPASDQKSTSPKDQGSTGNADAAVPPADNGDFAKMLNEITGKDEPPIAQTSGQGQPDAEKKATPSPATNDTEQVAISRPVEQPVKEQDQPVVRSAETEMPETDSKQKEAAKGEPAFITFIPDKKESSTAPKEQSSENSDVASIPAVDSGVSIQKEQRKLKKEQLKEEPLVEKEAPASGDSSSDNDFEAALRAAESSVHRQPVKVVDEGSTEDNRIQSIPNSDCKNRADEEAFQKIRRKMASRSDQEGVYRIAEKYFKGGVCYSSAQIKSLSYLFTSDEYKYKFLELAYPHVYDTSHFASLVKTMSDEYYRGRFNALIGK